MLPKGIRTVRLGRSTAFAFEGFPYLVTGLHPQLFHLLPVEPAPPQELARLLREQASVNRLPTALAVNWNCTHIAYPDGTEVLSPSALCSPHWLAGSILLPPGPAPSPRLQFWNAVAGVLAGETRPKGALFGDLTKGGRPPTEDERMVLTGADEHGRPRGLSPCPVCLQLKGVCIDAGGGPSTGLLVQVDCRCDNDTRCAACGEPFDHENRVGSNYFDPGDGKIWHVPAFQAIAHRCRRPAEVAA